jgi:hypothetical protein
MSSTWASFIYDLDPNDCEGRNPGTANLPVYSVLKPQNIVCDANAITLAYVEQDDFGEEGIQWILDHSLDYNRQDSSLSYCARPFHHDGRVPI